jgi:hypothetical protein
MPDWLQAVLTPATIMAAVWFVSKRIERAITFMKTEHSVLKDTVLHGPSGGAEVQRYHKEAMRQALEEKTFTHG